MQTELKVTFVPFETQSGRKLLLRTDQLESLEQPANQADRTVINMCSGKFHVVPLPLVEVTARFGGVSKEEPLV